jgi:hypothetical protein
MSTAARADILGKPVGNGGRVSSNVLIFFLLLLDDPDKAIFKYVVCHDRCKTETQRESYPRAM